MRKNGVDMPDPEPDANGNVRPNIPAGVDQTKLQTAFRACQSTVAGIQQGPAGQDQQAQLVDFSKCMRTNGVAEFPDPKESASGGGISPFPGYGPGTESFKDPKVQAAFKICQSKLNLPGTGG
jgi:hypothetical protein